MTTKRLGEEGFRWFIGVVENNSDPMKLGRCQIRVINEHDDPSIQTEDLPWAFPMQNITSAAYLGTGQAPVGLLNGSHVFGFFMDGQEKQLPIIMGPYAKMTDGTNDVPQLAIGNNIIPDELIGPEPASSYAAQYPYNSVLQTQSGHSVEIDDTPSQERMRVYHTSGTYVEINSDGRIVIKSVDNSYEIVAGDKTLYVTGDCNIQVQGDCNITSDGETQITTGSGVVLDAGCGVNIINSGNITTDGNMSSGSGATGSFTSSTGKIITVQNGIVTSIY